MYPFWIFWKNFEKSQRQLSGKVYIVMGAQRSGTSMMSQLVSACGVYWGEIKDLKSADSRNPYGFFEHNEFFHLSRKFLNEAHYRTENDIHINYDLRPKGAIAKLSRLFTRAKMLRLLKKFSYKQDKWGFKMFPIFFYFWKNYLPKPKIIGVFREPISSAHSMVNFHIGGRYTFEQALKFWNNSNRQLIYHLSVNEGILIKYEDLFNSNKCDKVLSALIDLVEGGDIKYLKTIIDHTLNRSGKKTENLQKSYPLSSDIKKTWSTLEKLKI